MTDPTPSSTTLSSITEAQFLQVVKKAKGPLKIDDAAIRFGVKPDAGQDIAPLHIEPTRCIAPA